MTINVNPARNEYTANAGQTVFNYTFKIYVNTDLNVYVTPAGQAPDCDLDLVTDYTVTGVGLEDGGTITLGTPASNGDLVTIVSDIPDNRTTDYQNNGDFLPDTVNNDFDRMLSLQKQVEDVTNRSAFTFPECLQGAKPRIFTPTPNSYLGYDSDLNPVSLQQPIELEADLIEVDTIPALRLISPPSIPNQLAAVLGHQVASDGGGGWFYWDAASTETDDNGLVIEPTSSTGAGRWVRLFAEDYVLPMYFGSITSSGHIAFTAAIASGRRVVVPEGVTVVTSASVTLISGCHVTIDGTVSYTAPSVTEPAFEGEDTDNVCIDGSGLILMTNPGSFSGCDGILFKKEDNTKDTDNICVRDVKIQDFSQHGVQLRGANLSPIASYPIVSLADLDSRKGFTNVKIQGITAQDCTTTGIILYGNTEKFVISGNTLIGCSMKADIYCKNGIISGNYSDSSIIVEGGCESIEIVANRASKISSLVGTITTAAGENGEPFSVCSNIGIHDNICVDSVGASNAYGIETIGHAGSPALSIGGGDAYDAPAVSAQRAMNISITGNTVTNSQLSGVLISRCEHVVCSDNQLAGVGSGVSDDRNGIDVVSTRDAIISDNIISDADNGRSIRVRGALGAASLKVDVHGNHITNTNNKTSEIEIEEFCEDSFVGRNTFDSNANTFTVIGAALNMTTERSTYIQAPGVSYSSVDGGATFKPSRSGISERIDLSTGTVGPRGVAYNKFDVSLPQSTIETYVVGARFLYEVAHSAGTAATLTVGLTGNTSRFVAATNSLVAGASVGTIQELTIATSRKVNADEFIVVSVSSGTTDAEGRFQVDYVEF